MMGEVIRVSGRAPDVGDLLREAMVSQRFADVALCCSGGQRFLAHRLVLSAASPYLQDVLLAHSKAAGFCEPITVILAEVEGPELAAILGFVYTGSATIPRSRLEAFTHAAETLRVRIPPLTVPSYGHRRSVDECKHDNVKIEETKIDSRYLGCEQYPSYDKWFDSPGWPFDGCFQRGDWLASEDEKISRLIRGSDESRCRRMDSRVERSFVGTNDFPASDKMTLAERSFVGTNDLPADDNMTIAERSFVGTNDFPANDKMNLVERSFVGTKDFPANEKITLAERSFVGTNDFPANDKMNLVERSFVRTKDFPANDKMKLDESSFVGTKDFPAEDKMQPVERSFVETNDFSSDDKMKLIATSFVGTNDFHPNGNMKLSNGKVLAASTWMSNDLPIFDGTFVEASISGRFETGNHDDRHSRSSRIPSIVNPADRESRIDTLTGNDNSVSRMIGEPVSSREDEAATIRSVEATKRHDNNDFEGRPAESVPSLPLVHRTTGRSSVTFEKQDYDADVAASAGTLAGGTAQTSATSTVTSNIGTNTKSLPICGESCCRWTTPRRHVANRVPASPWIQLARPAHHSPKIQPIVLRNREDNVEPSRLEWNDGASSMRGRRTSPFPSAVQVDQSSSAPLNLHHPTSSNDCPTRAHYGFKVPANATSPHLYDAPNYQRSQFLFSMTSLQNATEQFPPRISVTEVVRDSKTSSFDDPPVSSRLRSMDECPNTASPDEAQGGISQHAISPEAKNHPSNDPLTCNLQPSPRVELSHPISRLCESVSSNSDFGMQEECSKEKNINSPMRLEIIKTNVEETRGFASKFIYPLTDRTVRSDKNNNEAEAIVVEVSRNVAISSGGGNEATSSSEEHRCDQCGKTFVTRASLKVHGRTHSGEKPFRCGDCGKEFSQLRNYKYHRSVHEGTREFAATCPECGKYFNDRGYLSSHMKIHRNRKEYACAECGKSFNQRVAYNMHVRIHTGVKPHQCEQCGKAFSRKMLLKQHLRTHSGERPYQCQICHKAFADRSNMTLHTRLHSGLKPYQCTLCTKAFTKKHHLKTHLNYHTGTKPYSCPNCSLRFSQSSNMRTHYKKCSAASGENSSKRPADGRNDVSTSTVVASSSVVVVAPGDVKPTSGSTNALTPPSSDQESSILTPSEEMCKSNRGYPTVRSEDIGTSVNDP